MIHPGSVGSSTKTASVGSRHTLKVALPGVYQGSHASGRCRPALTALDCKSSIAFRVFSWCWQGGSPPPRVAARVDNQPARGDRLKWTSSALTRSGAIRPLYGPQKDTDGGAGRAAGSRGPAAALGGLLPVYTGAKRPLRSKSVGHKDLGLGRPGPADCAEGFSAAAPEAAVAGLGLEVKAASSEAQPAAESQDERLLQQD